MGFQHFDVKVIKVDEIIMYYKEVSVSLENTIENGYEELLYQVLEFDHNPLGSMSSTTALTTDRVI